MSNTKHAPRHARSNSLVGQPQATAMPAGSVTAIDGAGLPPIHTPNEADIYKAVGELEKKIQQLSRNQKPSRRNSSTSPPGWMPPTPI